MATKSHVLAGTDNHVALSMNAMPMLHSRLQRLSVGDTHLHAHLKRVRCGYARVPCRPMRILSRVHAWFNWRVARQRLAAGHGQSRRHRGAAKPTKSPTSMPPTRAVSIAPGARHHITVLEAAELGRCTWTPAPTPTAGRVPRSWSRRCARTGAVAGRVRRPAAQPGAQALAQRADPGRNHPCRHGAGCSLPHPQTGDATPARHARPCCAPRLNAPPWRMNSSIGASERTVARLFGTNSACATSSGASRPSWPMPC